MGALACVAWRFLSNLRAIGKRESRDKERQSREEPGRETACVAWRFLSNLRAIGKRESRDKERQAMGAFDLVMSCKLLPVCCWVCPYL